MSEHHGRGLLLVTLGVLCLVPDGTLVRAIDAGSATTSMWRSGLVTVAVAGFLAVRYGRGVGSAFRAVGWAGLLSAVLWAIGTNSFVAAVDRTSVGNAVIILATSPLWAAIGTRLFLGESLPRRTLVAIPIAFGGVALAFAGSAGSDSLDGDLIALVAAVATGANLTVVRYKSDVDMVPPAAIGGALAFVVLMAIGTTPRLEPGDLGPVLLLGLVLLPAALVLIVAGARYIPSPESALLLLLETVLSPILAAAAIDEPIEAWTLAGGAVVVATLAWHAWAAAGAERTVDPAYGL